MREDDPSWPCGSGVVAGATPCACARQTLGRVQMTIREDANKMIQTNCDAVEERGRVRSGIARQLHRVDEEGVTQKCGICRIFSRSKNVPSVKGTSRKTSTTGSSRLQDAQMSLQNRVVTLKETMDRHKSEAARLCAQSKKTEALVAMKRFKMVEKQFLSASSAVDTLERQLMSLEEASLQQEIASALSSSVQSVKKKTKGLLQRTENAVDSSVEVSELAEDVGAAFQGLNGTSSFDDDELFEELQKMTKDTAEYASPSAAPSHKSAPTPHAWPSAPISCASKVKPRRGEGQFHKLVESSM